MKENCAVKEASSSHSTCEIY